MIAIPLMGTLSEARSRSLVSSAGIEVSPWTTASDATQAAQEAEALGFPVAMKLNGDRVAHKTELDLVRLGLASREQVAIAATDLLARGEDNDDLLLTPMVVGNRELIAGLVRDEEFGPCVMLGLGGVLAEAIAKVSFRLAPLGMADALDLIEDLGIEPLLGPFRGEPALNLTITAELLISLGNMANDPRIISVDLNPLVIANGRPVAVDALVELATRTTQ